ncbi:MAG: hypothetical protein HC888_01825 [Candidatus Competibacteraceae bacterium]|nr:hypothetical protein [Candidatus Competibacteraceae bacterium]
MSIDVRDIPIDKTSDYSAIPAIQAGVPRIWCYINRFCPFTKGSTFNDALVFNASTIDSYPKSFLDRIETVIGTDGIFLRREYSYRHNFIFGRVDGEKKDELPGTGLFNNGAEPIYKTDQSWQIINSVYHQSNDILIPKMYTRRNVNSASDNTNRCLSYPVWQYRSENNKSSVGGETTSENSTDTPESSIMMPCQVATSLCQGEGVHWRLLKETDLFQGEDFFVEFHRLGSASDIPGVSDSLTWQDEYYSGLNVKSEASITPTKNDPYSQLPKDIGVTYYSEKLENDGTKTFTASDTTTYDFRNQAYYIIEVGVNDPIHNYALLITQRGPIRLVRIMDGRSCVISEFTGKTTYNQAISSDAQPVSGLSLINADWFRVTVRNHLGKLIIEFETPGSKSEPWVIERLDLVIESGNLKEESRLIYIPKGKMSLWGGNIACGFTFSPLQYRQPSNGDFSFQLPVDNYGLGFEVEVTTASNNPASQNYFALPSPKYTDHNIVFSSTDKPLDDYGMARRDFYTCDAQKVTEIRGSNSKFAFPSFFSMPTTTESSPKIVQIKETQFDQRLSELKVTKKDVRQDQSTRNEMFKLELQMVAGSHRFDSGWTLTRCKTPILTHLRLQAIPRDVPRWGGNGFEASDHVLSFSESWSAQDFRTIDHTGDITFLLNEGAYYPQNQTEKILSLRDKAFYIEIYAGYAESANSPYERGIEGGCNYSLMPNAYKLFTGICYGGKLEFENGKKIMHCRLEDYKQVLRDQRIFNSPFYDGVRDFDVVDELLKMSGFRYESPNTPGFFLTQAVESNDSTFRATLPDGRRYYAAHYILPASYDQLNQPKFRFSDGDTFEDCISRVSTQSGAVFYFDQFGAAHYESYQDIVLRQIAGEGEISPLFAYTTLPQVYPGQLVWDQVSVQHDVGTVFNHVKVLTNTPDFTPIFGDDVNWSSFDDPSSEGFVGYLKTLYQQETGFGSLRSLKNWVAFSAAFRRPPYVVNFKSYGLPVRALDIVSLNGQPLRVMRVDSRIDAETATWMQNFECEWMLPIIGVPNNPNPPRPA